MCFTEFMEVARQKQLDLGTNTEVNKDSIQK